MTSSIRTATRSALAAALLVAGTMACSSKSNTPTLGSDLQGDLEAAQSSSIELANEGPRRTQVVSAEELTGRTPAARAPERAPQAAPRTAAPRKATTSSPAPSAPSVVVAPTPEPQPVVNADTLSPIEPRPEPSRPAATPSRRGGYKSVGEVIRNAPFPINP